MINTTLCYIENDGKYLMIHRVKKKNDMNHDKWIGVGGKFEAGESPYDCALREIREECGIAPENLKYRGIVTFVSDEYGTEYMHLFTANGYEGEVNYDCDEGELVWLPKPDIRKLPLWEGDHIFLDLIESDAPFFSLKLEYTGDKLKNHELVFA